MRLRRDSGPDSPRGAFSAPQTLAGFLGRERSGEGKGKKGGGSGKEEEGREGKSEGELGLVRFGRKVALWP